MQFNDNETKKPNVHFSAGFKYVLFFLKRMQTNIGEKVSKMRTVGQI